MPQPGPSLAAALPIPLLLAGLMALMYWQLSQHEEQEEQEAREVERGEKTDSSHTARDRAPDSTPPASLPRTHHAAAFSGPNGPLTGVGEAAAALLSGWRRSEEGREAGVPTRQPHTDDESFVDGFTEMWMPAWHANHRRGEQDDDSEDEVVDADEALRTSRQQTAPSHSQANSLPSERAVTSAASPPRGTVPTAPQDSTPPTSSVSSRAESDGWERLDTSATESVVSVSTHATSTATEHPTESRSTRQRKGTSSHGRGLCCVCQEAPSCVLYQPCNHVCVCEACADRIASGVSARPFTQEEGTQSRQQQQQQLPPPPSREPTSAQASPSLMDAVFTSVFAFAAGVAEAAADTVSAALAETSRPRCPICNQVYTGRTRVFVC